MTQDQQPNGNTISLAEAMDRTNFWRQTVKPLFGDDINLVPKGFFIPFKDIQALADQYPEAAGARAYFTLLEPGFSDGEGVRGVLVPCIELLGEDGITIYKDLIITPGDESTGSTDPSGTSLYDFTKPCPPSCDISSPLF